MVRLVSTVSWLFLATQQIHGLQQPQQRPSRRETLGWILGGGASLIATTSAQQPAWGAAAAIQDTMDVDSFLRTGVDIGGPMGVSSQAGKSRPETGVYLRYVSRRKGN